jgi:hypothetical protein
VRVRREQRAVPDGYGSELIPGIASSADAQRLGGEIAFASARLKLLATSPPGLYGELREQGASDLERAGWGCFLVAYLSPLEGPDPFAAIRMALERAPAPDASLRLDDLEAGPRSSYDPDRASGTLLAYRQWAAREGFLGDPSWSPERRFERIFERLALPGFARMGRYELLVTLGRLGLYELRGETLGLSAARGHGRERDLTAAGAKRVFGIGDPLLLERRAQALARALEVPLEALDLALANWEAGERATLGVPEPTGDESVLERAGAVLGV